MALSLACKNTAIEKNLVLNIFLIKEKKVEKLKKLNIVETLQVVTIDF